MNQVTCIRKPGGNYIYRAITKGEKYDIISEDVESYKICDDNGEKRYYEREYFMKEEPIKPEPLSLEEPPRCTHCGEIIAGAKHSSTIDKETYELFKSINDDNDRLYEVLEKHSSREVESKYTLEDLNTAMNMARETHQVKGDACDSYNMSCKYPECSCTIKEWKYNKGQIIQTLK